MATGTLYVIGFRVSNGFILPPQTKSSTGKYYPLCYFTKSEAENLYDTIIQLGWNEKYNLNMKKKEHSIQDLLISASYFSIYFGR